MRQAFADESGTNPWEPYFVVAGPIVHADKQLIPVEEHILGLAVKHLPEADREGFVFHAADIWNNNEYFTDKEQWPREKCWDILWDLASVPYLFGLPIALGLKRKEHVAEAIDDKLAAMDPKEKSLAYDTVDHGMAFVDFAHVVENMMKEQWPDEVAELIAENRSPKIDTAIADVHHTLKSLKGMEGANPPWSDFPLIKIRGGIKFAAKRDEPLLQIADTCAYIIRGNLAHAPFYHVLYQMLLRYPAGQIWPPLEWPDGPLVPLWKQTQTERESELGRLRVLLRGDGYTPHNPRKRSVK